MSVFARVQKKQARKKLFLFKWEYSHLAETEIFALGTMQKLSFSDAELQHVIP